MSAGFPDLPPRETQSEHLLQAASRYFERDGSASVLRMLPIPEAHGPVAGPWREVELPQWAADRGVGDPPSLLVPPGAVTGGSQPAYLRCDWWMAAFVHLSGWEEAAEERRRGPIHSYALRYARLDRGRLRHAWVNRIMLFLRRWAAQRRGVDETAIFGALPPACLELSHDVDAVRKTTAIRFKQTVFEGIGCLRHAARGDLTGAWDSLGNAARFALTTPDYDCFEELCSIATAPRLAQVFYFFGGSAGRRRRARDWLFDPGYEPAEPDVRAILHRLRDAGLPLGLHPSFDSWQRPQRLRAERERLEAAAGIPVRRCRQHWLRFSWRDTWRCQSEAGFEEDSTLGFNDTPGFRTGAALRYRPWDHWRGRAHDIHALPLILMDSHLYSYSLAGASERRALIGHFVGEVHAVHGHASVLWHPHTLAPDYGWAQGFSELVECVRATPPLAPTCGAHVGAGH